MIAIVLLLGVATAVVVLVTRSGTNREAQPHTKSSKPPPSGGRPDADDDSAGVKSSITSPATRDGQSLEGGPLVTQLEPSKFVPVSLSGDRWQAEVFRAVARTVCTPGVLPEQRPYAGVHMTVVESEAMNVVGIDPSRGINFSSKPGARERFMLADDAVMDAFARQVDPWTVPVMVRLLNMNEGWKRTPAVLYLHRDDCAWAVDGEPPPGRTYAATCEFMPDHPLCNAR